MEDLTHLQGAKAILLDQDAILPFINLAAPQKRLTASLDSDPCASVVVDFTLFDRSLAILIDQNALFLPMMNLADSQKRIAALPDSNGPYADPLTELIRVGARELIEQALEVKLNVLLAQFSDSRTRLAMRMSSARPSA